MKVRSIQFERTFFRFIGPLEAEVAQKKRPLKTATVKFVNLKFLSMLQGTTNLGSDVHRSLGCGTR